MLLLRNNIWFDLIGLDGKFKMSGSHFEGLTDVVASNSSSDGRVNANVVCKLEGEHSRSMLRAWASSSSYVIQLYIYHNIQQPGTLLSATLLAFLCENFFPHHVGVIKKFPFHLEERNQCTSFSFASVQNPVASLSNSLNLFSSSRKSSGSSSMRRQSVLLKWL